PLQALLLLQGKSPDLFQDRSRSVADLQRRHFPHAKLRPGRTARAARHLRALSAGANRRSAAVRTLALRAFEAGEHTVPPAVSRSRRPIPPRFFCAAKPVPRAPWYRRAAADRLPTAAGG